MGMRLPYIQFPQFARSAKNSLDRQYSIFRTMDKQSLQNKSYTYWNFYIIDIDVRVGKSAQ